MSGPHTEPLGFTNKLALAILYSFTLILYNIGIFAYKFLNICSLMAISFSPVSLRIQCHRLNWPTPRDLFAKDNNICILVMRTLSIRPT